MFSKISCLDIFNPKLRRPQHVYSDDVASFIAWHVCWVARVEWTTRVLPAAGSIPTDNGYI